MRKRVLHPVLLGLVVAAAAAGSALGIEAMQAPASAVESARPLVATQQVLITGLVPGGTPKRIAYSITNQGSTPRQVSTLAFAVNRIRYAATAGTGVGTTWINHPAGGPAPGCTPADFVVVAPRVPRGELAPGATVFVGAGRGTGPGTIAMLNSNRNQDDCHGVAAAVVITVA